MRFAGRRRPTGRLAVGTPGSDATTPQGLVERSLPLFLCTRSRRLDPGTPTVWIRADLHGTLSLHLARILAFAARHAPCYVFAPSGMTTLPTHGIINIGRY